MANPSATITTRDNGRFSELIAGYWIDVAAELDLEGEEITDIQKSSSQYPTAKDKAFRVLEILRQRECTYKQLAEALQRLKKGGHAKQVLPPQEDEKLKEKEIMALSKRITGEYKDVGSKLGLTFDEVGRFTNNDTLKSNEDKALEMLKFWFRGTKSTNKRETLAKALEDVPRRDLAQEVRNKTLLG